jgi:hypothetical protein
MILGEISPPRPMAGCVICLITICTSGILGCEPEESLDFRANSKASSSAALPLHDLRPVSGLRFEK